MRACNGLKICAEVELVRCNVRPIDRWRKWAGANEPQSFVARLTVKDEGILDFLAGLLTEIRSSGGYSVTRTPKIRRRDVAEFIDPEALVARVNVIHENMWDSLSQNQQNAVEAFLNPGRWE